MAISRLGTVAVTAGSGTPVTSAAATLPASIAANDLIIIAVHRTNDYVLTGGAPAGYTLLRNILDPGTTPNAVQTDIYYKIASGSEGTTGPTFTTGTATRWIIHAGVYRGVNTTTPFLTEDAVIQATSVVTHDGPALTNTSPDAWAVFAVCSRASTSGQSWTPDSRLSERLDTDLGTANTSNIYAEWSDSNGVVASGTYTYQATGTVANGIATHWAAFLNSATAAPPPPTGLVVQPATDTQAVATWNPVAGAISYDLELDGTVIAFDIADTTYSITGLTAGSSHGVRVRSNS